MYEDEDLQQISEDIQVIETEVSELRRDLNNSTASVSGTGENVTLNNTAEAEFKKFEVQGNSTQEVIEAVAGTTVSGENINASSINLDKVEILDIQGNTKQETTTGKNLWDNSNIVTTTSNNKTYTANGDGTFTLSGTASSVSYLDLKKEALSAGTYKLSTGVSTGWTGNVVVAIDGNNYICYQNQEVEITLTEQATMTSAYIRCYSGDNSTVIIKPMLRLSSVTDDTYEPYTGGQASPNPDYPQEIESVGENVNLFNYLTAENNKWMNTAGEISDSSDPNIVSDFIPVVSGTQYTLSGLSDSFMIRVCSFVSNNQNSFKTTLINYTNQRTFTSDANYVRIAIGGGNAISIKESIKLEKGDKTTAYSPYGQGCANVTVCNENKLAYPSISSVSFSNVTFEHNEGIYTISTDGTSTSPTSSDDYPVENYTIQEGDYIHYNNSFIDSHIGFRLVFSDGTSYFNSFASSTNRIISLANYIGKTITAIGFNWNTGYTFTGTCKPMITNSSTSTDYIPHQSQNFTIPTQSPFRKIGDIADSFVNRVGVWYEKHYIIRKILDGTENWIQDWTGSTQHIFKNTDYLSDSKRYSTATQNIICKSNYFIATHFDGGTGSMWDLRKNDSYPYLIAITDKITETYVGAIFIKHQDIDNLSDFKTWLQTQYANGTPVYVDYILETPIYIECTQEQSTILDQINTFYETTNIYSVDEISPYFSFTYNKVYASPSPDDASEIHNVGDNVNLFSESKLTQEEDYNTYNETTGLWSTSTSGAYYRSIFYSVTGQDSIRDVSKIIKLEANTSYALKFYDFTASISNFTLNLGFFNNSGVYINSIDFSTNSVVFKTNESCYLDIRRKGNSGNCSFSKVKLEKGNRATSYSPYNQGNAEIIISNKNLFNKNTVENGKYINSAGEIQSYDAYALSDYISVKPSTKYSYQGISTFCERLAYYDKNKNLISAAIVSALPQYQTITTPSNCYYFRTTVLKVDVDAYQFEENTASTSYVEHKQQTFTFPLGNEKLMLGDYLADDGIHHTRKQISVSISYIFTLSNGKIGGVADILNKIYEPNNSLLCNKATFTKIPTHAEGTVYENPANAVFVGNENDTLTTMRNKYNGATLEYELEEEEITSYTSAQQAVYNAIKKAMSYEEQTNVYSVDGVSPIFIVKAFRNMNSSIESLQARIELLPGRS